MRYLTEVEADRLRGELLDSAQEFSRHLASVPGRLVVPGEEVIGLTGESAEARPLGAFSVGVRRIAMSDNRVSGA
jgi:hypothetical protein